MFNIFLEVLLILHVVHTCCESCLFQGCNPDYSFSTVQMPSIIYYIVFYFLEHWIYLGKGIAVKMYWKNLVNKLYFEEWKGLSMVMTSIV